MRITRASIISVLQNYSVRREKEKYDILNAAVSFSKKKADESLDLVPISLIMDLVGNNSNGKKTKRFFRDIDHIAPDKNIRVLLDLALQANISRWIYYVNDIDIYINQEHMQFFPKDWSVSFAALVVKAMNSNEVLPQNNRIVSFRLVNCKVVVEFQESDKHTKVELAKVLVAFSDWNDILNNERKR